MEFHLLTAGSLLIWTYLRCKGFVVTCTTSVENLLLLSSLRMGTWITCWIFQLDLLGTLKLAVLNLLWLHWSHGFLDKSSRLVSPFVIMFSFLIISVSFIYIAQYHKSQICLNGFRVCTVCTGKKWKKPQEEQQSRDPSPRTDRHAIDVLCTEQTKIEQL